MYSFNILNSKITPCQKIVTLFLTIHSSNMILNYSKQQQILFEMQWSKIALKFKFSF